MTTILLIAILAVVIINHIAVRAMKVEIKSIKNDLSFIDNDNEKEADNSTHDMINSMHDSLLGEIQNLETRFDDIRVDLVPSEELSEDALYKEALAITLQARKCSASFLQRKLRIGYSRAARLVDMLEENGIVGEANGVEPRKILSKE